MIQFYEFTEELQEGLTPEQFAKRKREEIEDICSSFYIIRVSDERKEEVLENMVEEYEKEYEMYLKEQHKS